MVLTFVIEQAGCSSCADLIRAALGDVGSVEEVAIDQGADTAAVRLVPRGSIGIDDLNRVLSEASAGSGHEYRVASGSLTHLT